MSFNVNEPTTSSATGTIPIDNTLGTQIAIIGGVIVLIAVVGVVVANSRKGTG